MLVNHSFKLVILLFFLDAEQNWFCTKSTPTNTEKDIF